MESLKSKVYQFLHLQIKSKKGLLLALSGGPDSLALLHVLLSYRNDYAMPIAIAHVNHNWRPESGNEAFLLEALARQYHIPFHLHVLDPSELNGNLEAACRQARLHFFKALCKEFDYQALLLGHHADDQAETILKRVFEGSGLTNLKGLQPVATIDGVKCWRPFLSITKKQIQANLEEKEFKAFLDPTNKDCRFLRARLREKIIPMLSEIFGKEVCPSLVRLSNEAQELDAYMDTMVKPILDQMPEGYWDLRPQLTSPYLLKQLIRTILSKEGFDYRDAIVLEIRTLLMEEAANKKIVLNGRTIYIDRGRIFFAVPPEALPSIPLKISAKGEYAFGCWKVIVEHAEQTLKATNWQDILKGSARAPLGSLPFFLMAPSPNSKYPGKNSLAKWWGEHKVPAFLRGWAPILQNRDCVEHEFLTGRVAQTASVDAFDFQIRLLRKRLPP